MASQPTILSFFETPLIVDKVPDSATLNAGLLAKIDERRAADQKGLALSNRLGWHSDTQMLSWGGEPAMRLIEHAMSLADRFTQDTGGSGARYIWWPEMWANVSKRDASNQFHTHPGAFWAVVYYVEDGYEGSSDPALGGEIVLEDPRMPMMLMEGPDLRFRPNPTAAVSDSVYRYRPAAGTMLMFPAWLRHGVNPYFGSATRISIAINLAALLPPEMPS